MQLHCGDTLDTSQLMPPRIPAGRQPAALKTVVAKGTTSAIVLFMKAFFTATMTSSVSFVPFTLVDHMIVVNRSMSL
jgi:hypothetical protein